MQTRAAAPSSAPENTATSQPEAKWRHDERQLRGPEVLGEGFASQGVLSISRNPSEPHFAGIPGRKVLCCREAGVPEGSWGEEGGLGLGFVGVKAASAPASQPGVGGGARQTADAPSQPTLPETWGCGARERGCPLGRLQSGARGRRWTCSSLLRAVGVVRALRGGCGRHREDGRSLEGALGTARPILATGSGQVAAPGLAARRRRLPWPGAAAGAAPGSHGRRQVPESRAGSPQSRADGSRSDVASSLSLRPRPGRPGRQVSGSQVSAPTCAPPRGPPFPAPGRSPRHFRRGTLASSAAPLPAASPRLGRPGGLRSPRPARSFSSLRPARYFALGAEEAPELGEPGHRAGHLPAAPAAQSPLTDSKVWESQGCREPPAPASGTGVGAVLETEARPGPKGKPAGDGEDRLLVLLIESRSTCVPRAASGWVLGRVVPSLAPRLPARVGSWLQS
ncbi:hypothetical protein P7K49_027544 [Saguinus oedipus]|uniref:Uncharacterized protein n=1 Tax=Saguinus oedipus TaxID=9490 RepID=A0ABQ9U9S2_SAGOE|nr:hypothetical protein P7K49_027544 [Saguinus oedipus]